MTDESITTLYDRAVDLYVHEDQLNWTKLNNLIYVTGGLLAVLGLTLDLSDGLVPLEGAEAVVIQVVSAFGMLVSVAFAVALNSGVKYLLARKAAVIRMEAVLAGESGCRVVTPGDSDGKTMRVSPTSVLLRCTPIVVGLGWLGLLLVSFVV